MAAARNHRQSLRLSPEVAAAMTTYRWPGNVRELRNAVERAAVLAQGDVITPEYLPDAMFHDAPPVTAAGAHPASLEEVEREQIVRVLGESPTLEDAAETLGINVSTLWRKRKRYKIE